MNLAKAIENDLMERVSDASLKEPLNRVAEMHQRSAENMSDRSVDPDGKARKALSAGYRAKKQKVGGSGDPDLYLSGTARNSLDYRTSGKEIKFTYRDGKAGEYMWEHEHGKRLDSKIKTRLPQRRYFPNEKDSSIPNFKDDMKTPAQAENIREVEDILEAHFNQDRTIRVKG